MNRIAVWNTAFLGDAILTLPLLESLKQSFPDASLDFYVRQGFEELFTASPFIDDVIGFRKKNISLRAMGAFSQSLRAKQYTLWVDAHPSFRSGLIAKFSGATYRVGYAETPLSTFWFDKAISRRFDDLDEIERLLQLCPAAIEFLDTKKTQMGGDERSLVHWPHLILPEKALQNAQLFFAPLLAQQPGARFLGMHPGSVWATKRWPIEYFFEIAQKAAARGSHILLFAGPGEEKISEQLKNLLFTDSSLDKELIHDFSCALSLVELAAFIGELNCYVTNDSGPMHLAWVQGTPVTALFGPTVKSLGFFPRGEGATVFESNLPCRPCGLHGHATCPKGHHDCMVLLKPERVWPDVAYKLGLS